MSAAALFLPWLIISSLLLLSCGGGGGATMTTLPGLMTTSPNPISSGPGLASAARLLHKARKARMNREFLEAHNAARLSVGMPVLKWDTRLARFAALWIRNHQADCKMTHSGGPYGENMLWHRRGKKWTPARVVAEWVKERQCYDPMTNTCAAGMMCGHYTQIIWRKTTSVGCASVKCDNGAGFLVVCEYSPPGNYEGESPFDDVPVTLNQDVGENGYENGNKNWNDNENGNVRL